MHALCIFVAAGIAIAHAIESNGAATRLRQLSLSNALDWLEDEENIDDPRQEGGSPDCEELLSASWTLRRTLKAAVAAVAAGGGELKVDLHQLDLKSLDSIYGDAADEWEEEEEEMAEERRRGRAMWRKEVKEREEMEENVGEELLRPLTCLLRGD